MPGVDYRSFNEILKHHYFSYITSDKVDKNTFDIGVKTAGLSLSHYNGSSNEMFSHSILLVLNNRPHTFNGLMYKAIISVRYEIFYRWFNGSSSITGLLVGWIATCGLLPD